MRILLLGKFGQLGWELQRTLAPLGEILARDYPEIDLVHPESLRSLVYDFRPELIVNATAYTAVDRAESEAETAFAINAAAPGILAEEARNLGAGLIHFSTDYVFDGKKGELYYESDQPNPLNVYGKSKLAGERAILDVGGRVLILRTSWVYSLRRDSFVTKIMQWAREQPTLKVVTDQIGNPTWARMLAEVTAQLIARGGSTVDWMSEASGIYHLAGGGYASRLEWAQAILAISSNQSKVQPALTADFPTPAERPLFSALDCDHFAESFGLRLPDWKTALQFAMEAG